MVDKLSASGINIFHWSSLLGGAASTDVERLPIALHFIFTTSFTMNTVHILHFTMLDLFNANSVSHRFDLPGETRSPHSKIKSIV